MKDKIEPLKLGTGLDRHKAMTNKINELVSAWNDHLNSENPFNEREELNAAEHKLFGNIPTEPSDKQEMKCKTCGRSL